MKTQEKIIFNFSFESRPQSLACSCKACTCTWLPQEPPRITADRNDN